MSKHIRKIILHVRYSLVVFITVCIFFAVLCITEYRIFCGILQAQENKYRATVLKTAQSVNFTMLEIQRLSHMLMINSDVRSFVTQGKIEQGSPDIQTLIDTQRHLANIKSVHPAIDALYVYSKTSDYLLEADNAFFDIDTMYSSFFEFEGLNTGQWRSLFLRPVYANKYFKENIVVSKGVRRATVTFGQTLPLQNISSNTGKLVMFLKSSFFASQTEALFSFEESWVCIVDTDENPLFFRLHADKPLNEFLNNIDHVIRRSALSSTDSLSQKINGKNYLVFVQPLEASQTVLLAGVSYASLFSAIKASWFTIPLFLFCCALLGLCICIFSLRRFYAQNSDTPRHTVLSDSFALHSNSSVREKETTTTKRITDYIEKHYCESLLNLSQMAKDFGIKESFLYHFFRSRIQKSFACYLEDFRLEKARAFIETDIKEPVNTLAHRCGYTNPQTFRRAFKKKYGTTPSEFKRRVFADTDKL